MSASRLTSTFDALRAGGKKGLVTYVTAGDPDLPRSAAVIRAIARAGADVIEVGVPFSDPLADGPVIQRATERALKAGTTLTGVLDMIASLRREIAAPSCRRGSNCWTRIPPAWTRWDGAPGNVWRTGIPRLRVRAG